MSIVPSRRVTPNDDELSHASDEVPRRLREAREQAGLSLRQLARRLEISPSALSQIETGKSRPSVRTLYALVSGLNLSLDELFDNPAGDREGGRRAPGDGGGAHARSRDAVSPPPAGGPVLHADDRAWLDLDSGVRWERLTAEHDPLVDFLHVTYEPGGASNPRNSLVRHAGREYGVVLSGAIDVTVGFETYRCEPGDSISFSSDEPHLLANNTKEPATAIWFVVGRRGTDPRHPSFEN
jgi:transcriptional regulator with XRE-family HTH domain